MTVLLLRYIPKTRTTAERGVESVEQPEDIPTCLKQLCLKDLADNNALHRRGRNKLHYYMV